MNIPFQFLGGGRSNASARPNPKPQLSRLAPRPSAGFLRVQILAHILENGLLGWVSAGFPMREGS